jgi:Mrp family chromosome partitioning ATPase/predicted Fe-Mo cluster-binding NifX family protein
MENIAHKFLVLSGKGGVGKSTVAVSLAVWLSMQGKNVGLLDIDIHGPSIPKLLGVSEKRLHGETDKITPIPYSDTLKVMSIGFLLPDESDAVIWRGPMKHNLIKQFVTDVAWGNLDYLIVDCPPGTGDEPLSVVQLIGSPDGAVIVTTPQQLAVVDVKKCISFCRQLNLPVLGVIENMSGFVCPHCNTKTDIFKASGGKQMAEDFNVPFLGSIPIDADMVSACDSGKPFIRFNSQSPTVQAIISAFKPLMQTSKQNLIEKEAKKTMRIAIPLTDGKLSQHFGHCEQFAIIDIDATSKDIKSQRFETPPPHEPGVLPQWLAGLSVDLIIAGGMGQRAKGLFTENNIDVVIGSPVDSPEQLISAYLEGRLQCGENTCDH